MATAGAASARTTGQGQQQLPRRRPASSCSKQKHGRGSKSNNRPPVVIAHECPSAMRAHVVEVPAGRDVLSCVSAFARRGRRGALVLGAAGHVTDVVLREPAALVLRGTMEILSLAGCFFPFPSSSATGTAAAVFLAGPRGSVLGGGVALGGLVAAGPVVVMVATFVAAALDRLPLPKGEDNNKAQQQQQQQGCDVHVHGHGHGHHRACGWAAVCRRHPKRQQQQLGANI